MKNQPNDELLSAYLDGELNDAERAEVERRLATDPTARRLLDQLRSVRQAVQSLPREPLGENLTRQVLEEAERRRQESDRPTPRTRRSWSERFLNRRAIAWASLTLIIGAAIALHERWQNDGLVRSGKPIKEVALASGTTSLGRKLSDEHLERTDAYRPPTIQAAPAPKSAADEESVRPEQAAASKPAAAAATPSKSSVHAKAAVSLEPQQSKSRKSNIDAGWENNAPQSGAPKVASPATPAMQFKHSAGTVTPAVIKQEEESMAKAAVATRNNNLLVIHCNISSKAAQSQAFDKLLISNGIVSVQRRAGPLLQGSDQKQTPAEHRNLAGKDEQSLFEAKSSPTDATRDRHDEDAANAEIVEVEATPAQLEATLAGLESRPDAFPLVLVGPVETPKVKQQTMGGADRSSVKSPQSVQSYGYAFAPSRESQRLENQRQLQLNFQNQPLTNASSQQRARFVLRVVNGHAAQQAESRPFPSSSPSSTATPKPATVPIPAR